jgi:ribonuclease BN (tRNA processing enzyme)
VEIRVLGARQGESRHSHFSSLLVDGVLALDAGGLTSTLTLAEQAAIHSVLITHQHFDHTKDLGAFGFNLFGRGRVRVHCTAEVRATLEATTLNERIWLDFFARPTPESPTFVHAEVEPDLLFEVAGYHVRPVPVPHAVPTLGYELTSPGEATLLYTGDNGPGAGAAWARTRPELLVTEVTYQDSETAQAARVGHLSPSLLAEELRAFRALHGYLPRVLVVHVNPFHEAQVAAEVAAVAADLQADIRVAEEGSTYPVGRAP